jgi:hypothetical protein
MRSRFTPGKRSLIRGWELYILDDKGEPVEETNAIKWAEWFEKYPRTIAYDVIGDSKISTVFLGLNHSFDKNKPPILWETMVFGGKHDGCQRRYSSQQKALRGHTLTVAMVRKELQ